MFFNLLTDPWIPVRRASGARAVIRPAQIAEAGDPPMVLDWSRPDFNLACLEMLIGLVYAAAAPKDAGDWRGRRPDAASLDNALLPLVPAFHLDGDGPRFLQDLDPLSGDPSGVDLLLIDSAGGNAVRNNSDLSVKRSRYAVFSRPTAAMALYALQAFAPSGGAGNRTSMRGGGPMVTLVEPRAGGEASIWDVVWANVPDGRPLPPDRLEAAFPWMRPTRTSKNGQAVHSETVSPPQVEAFFGMPRRLRLVFEPADGRRCSLTDTSDDRVVTGVVQRPHGTNYGLWRHPLTPYYRVKPGAEPLPVHPKPGRFGYRHWLGIALRDTDGLRTRASSVETYIQQQRHRRYVDADPAILIGGWAMDNMSPLDFVEARQPLPVAADRDLAEALEEACAGLVKAGTETNRLLTQALRTVFGTADAAKGDIANASESFFAATEPAFLAAVDALGRDPDAEPPRRTWLGNLRRQALREFERLALPGLADRQPEQARTVVDAHGRLRAAFAGYGKRGGVLYGAVGLTPPTTKAKDSAR